MRAALPGKIRQKIQFFGRRVRVQTGDHRAVVRGIEQRFIQPLVAAGGGEDTAHQVVFAVGVAKAVQRGIFGLHEGIGRNKHRAAGTKRNVAGPGIYRAGADRSRGVVPRPGADRDVLAEPERGLQLSDGRSAFEHLRQHPAGNAAYGQHLFGPRSVFYVEQQHAGRVADVGRKNARKHIVYVILGQTDLFAAGENLRLMRFYPQNFRRGKAGKRHIAR